LGCNNLLTALTGATIAHDEADILEALLADVQKLAQTDAAARVEVARIEAELASRRQTEARLHAQVAGASAKLKYLLGLNWANMIQSRDSHLRGIDLMKIDLSLSELVAQASAQGPGVREMQTVLDLLPRGRAALLQSCCARFAFAV
jgi:outer membrane protein TolC